MERLKRMANDWHVIVWVAAVLASLMLIGFRLNTSGAYVTYVSKDSPFHGIIKPGYIIREINGTPATPELIEGFNGSYAELKTNKGTYYSPVNGSLGISVKPVPRTNIRFGLDLEGGTRAILKAKGEVDRATVEQIISTLQTRINVYGLRETNFRPLGEGMIEVEMAGGTIEEMRELLSKQGVFEAVIPVEIGLENGKGLVKLDTEHEIEVADGKVLIDGKENGTIEGMKVYVGNVTDSSTVLRFVVFTGRNIKTVYFDSQNSRIQRVQNGYEWSFSVLIDQEAASNFAKVTRLLGIARDNLRYLESPLELYLDGQLMDSLRIASDLKGRAITQPAISGVANSREEALSSMKRLQSILRSGSLPVPIEIVSIDRISPRLGSRFVAEALAAGAVSILIISLIVLLYYRDPVISIPVIVSSFSEIVMVLGIAVVIKWTIDLASIAGILASIGASITDQVMMIDELESGRREKLTLKERIKRALFIIFGSAGISAVAMVPLLFTGYGILRGFAVTTWLGLAVSNFISRPAFNRIVEELVRGRHEGHGNHGKKGGHEGEKGKENGDRVGQGKAGEEGRGEHGGHGNHGGHEEKGHEKHGNAEGKGPEHHGRHHSHQHASHHAEGSGEDRKGETEAGKGHDDGGHEERDGKKGE